MRLTISRLVLESKYSLPRGGNMKIVVSVLAFFIFGFFILLTVNFFSIERITEGQGVWFDMFISAICGLLVAVWVYDKLNTKK